MVKILCAAQGDERKRDMITAVEMLIQAYGLSNLDVVATAKTANRLHAMFPRLLVTSVRHGPDGGDRDLTYNLDEAELLLFFLDVSLPRSADYQAAIDTLILSAAKQGVLWISSLEELRDELFGTAEQDPNGKDPHEVGAKLDAGKIKPSLILDDMSLAMTAVIEVATYGAKKYTEKGWHEVANAQDRYKNAQYRHRLAAARGEQRDPDSGLLHLAHEAWNALACLQLELEKTNESLDEG